MTYSLKLDVDGWQLATLVHYLVRRARACSTWAVAGSSSRYMVDAFALLHAFVHELPLGHEEKNTLKLNLTTSELDELEDVLQSAVREQGHADDALTECLLYLAGSVRGYRQAVAAVMRES